MKYEVSVIRTFSAAHALRGYRGKCENLHGHNWKIRVAASGEVLGNTGMLVDFTDLKSYVELVLSRLDHRNLNDVPPFNKINPTAENIAYFVFSRLKAELPKGVSLSEVEVWESETSSAKFMASGHAQIPAQTPRPAVRPLDWPEIWRNMRPALYFIGVFVISIILLAGAAAFFHVEIFGKRNQFSAVTREAHKLGIDAKDVLKNPGNYTGKPVEWQCTYLKGDTGTGIAAGSGAQLKVLGANKYEIKTGRQFSYTVLGKISGVKGGVITVEALNIYQTK